MRLRKPPRPTTDLFERDGSVLDVNDLHRRGAFVRPMWFPFRRLKTFRDRLEISWPDKNKPPQIILLERTRLYLGGERPWFLCPCGRRCGKLYLTTINARCRICSGLQFASQRQWRTTRLRAKAEKIRNRVWAEGEKIIRPRYMHKRTYDTHLLALHTIEHAIKTRSH
jgi:hypothetical protein